MIKSVKEAEIFFSSISRGLAASLSAYLIAMAVVPSGLNGTQYLAVAFAIFSMVLLAAYVCFEAFKYKMGLAKSSYPAILFAAGFTLGLIAYALILKSINQLFGMVFSFAVVLVLASSLFFVKSGRSPTYKEINNGKDK